MEIEFSKIQFLDPWLSSGQFLNRPSPARSMRFCTTTPTENYPVAGISPINSQGIFPAWKQRSRIRALQAGFGPNGPKFPCSLWSTLHRDLRVRRGVWGLRYQRVQVPTLLADQSAPAGLPTHDGWGPTVPSRAHVENSTDGNYDRGFSAE
jgi:hypothetical protein